MKEIGTKLKEARESIGVSIEEAAEDLKLKVSQIENLEAGNMEAFQDVFYLKYFIICRFRASEAVVKIPINLLFFAIAK